MTAKRLGLYKSNRLNDERCDLNVQSYQKKQQLVRTKQCCLILRLQQQGSVDLSDVAISVTAWQRSVKVLKTEFVDIESIFSIYHFIFIFGSINPFKHRRAQGYISPFEN